MSDEPEKTAGEAEQRADDALQSQSIRRCPYCDYTTSSAGDLNFHKIREHKKEFEAERASAPLIYKCRFCAEMFPNEYQRRKHENRSHADKMARKGRDIILHPSVISSSANKTKGDVAMDTDEKNDEESSSNEKENLSPDEHIFKSLSADIADRTQRLEDIIEHVPGISEEKKKWILRMWSITQDMQVNPIKLYEFLMSIKGMESVIAQRIVETTFGSSASAPMPYFGPYTPSPQFPTSMPYPGQYFPQYPYQQPYQPFPQINVEEAVRRARETWERDRELAEIRKTNMELLEEVKKLKEGRSNRADGMMTIRRQLVDASGKPLYNPDGTPTIQEIEVPAYQAAVYGFGLQQPSTPDIGRLLNDIITAIKGVAPQSDPQTMELRNKIDSLQRDLLAAQNKTAIDTLKSELSSQLAMLTKQLELERDKQKTLSELVKEFKNEQKTDKMEDAALVAIEELKAQTAIAGKGMDNLNKTITTAINVLGRGSMTVPEITAQMSEEERKKLKDEFGDMVE